MSECDPGGDLAEIVFASCVSSGIGGLTDEWGMNGLLVFTETERCVGVRVLVC
jgi:hypothetical protein